ncbi:MAG: hypothetical protein AB8H12_16615 [Lewinella sp.]
MNFRYASIIILFSLVYSSCSNSQGIQITPSSSYPNAQGSSEEIEASILQANKLFETYTNESPQGIDLFLLDVAAQLIRNPATELKEKPEGYLFASPAVLSKADTSLILAAYKKRLGVEKFLSLDASGKVLYYDTGKRAPKHNYKETTSIVPRDSLKLTAKRLGSPYRQGGSYNRKIEPAGRTNDRGEKLVKVTDMVLDTIDTDIVYVKDLSKVQLLGYAMEDYWLNNNNADSYLRGFLWLNFFYDYFDVNESSESTAVKPRWLLNFSVIDAAGLTLPDDFVVEPANLSPLKTIFNKDQGYETGSFSYSGIRRRYLVVPRKDDFYTEKWKYISLDLAAEFSFESKIFSQMVLIVNFMKQQYGADVVKELTTWYVANGKGPLLLTSFLKEKYAASTTINDLNQDYLNWAMKQ